MSKAPNSYHTLGRAVDIAFEGALSERDAAILYGSLLQMIEGGVGRRILCSPGAEYISDWALENSDSLAIAGPMHDGNKDGIPDTAHLAKHLHIEYEYSTSGSQAVCAHE